MPVPLRLHHLALGSPDPEHLACFYHRAFDLPVERTHRYEDGTVRSVWLRLASGVLMIEHVDPRTPHHSPRPKTPNEPSEGLFLLAFEVSKASHSEHIGRLETLGCVVEGSTSYTSYLRDPDGNRIALSHYDV